MNFGGVGALPHPLAAARLRAAGSVTARSRLWEGFLPEFSKLSLLTWLAPVSFKEERKER